MAVAEMIEQISPELVLVDPELARLVRAGPLGYGPVVPWSRPRPLPASSRPEVHRPARRRHSGWTSLAVGAVAFLGAVTAASEWPPVGSRPFLVDAASPVTVPGVAAAPAPSPPDAPVRRAAFSPPKRAHPVETAASGHASRNVAAGSAVERARVSVEHRLLGVLGAEAGRLVPRTIVDSRSGLLRDNVRVSCRAATTPRRFSCAVFGPSGRRVAVVAARLAAGGRLLLAP